MKGSQMWEIEESIRLLAEAANRLYDLKGGYATYGRQVFEIADEIQEQLDGEELE